MRAAEKAMKLLSLQDKVAVVTGGASGIGRGIAALLAEMGASVAVLDVDDSGGAATVNQIAGAGGKACFFHCDVRSATECAQAVRQVEASFYRIDILCNNAGLSVRKSVTELSEEEWDRSLDIMLKATFLLSREVIPHMARNGGGSIINTGSGWSLKGGPQAAAYCAAKGGVLNLTRAMAIDHGGDNIRVNCVCPGDVDTPLLSSECAQLRADRNTFMREASARPLPRVGLPQDVAMAVLFLVSEMARWITGIALVVDGGGLA